ncbi:carboxypeptidase B-like isoform X2 [Dendronephthya gigantea]|uniref:carboxypeptidase B-like isoform X2 n=1 Tax=Dendronephthya gigantea TaxID=151771 RepID=UPI001069F255|nr:carboxypeptidase B-like isoform X2 [Dendronephthya gigantea]
MFTFKLSVFLCFAVFTFVEAGQYDGKVLRVVPQTNEDLENLRSLVDEDGLQIDFWQGPAEVGRNVDIYVHEANLATVFELLKNFKLSYTVLIDDVQGEVDNENPPTSRAGGFQYERYNTLSAIHAEMQKLASTHSNIASLFSTGKSYEGNEQFAVKIRSQNSRKPKKTFFVNCGIHAREWITPATCMYMIREMLTKYGTDSSVKSMVDKMDWVIMPSLNPDGYKYTWNANRMWRRTKTKHSGCTGADPNRNWNYKWGGVGTSSSCGDTYHGPRPFSEVETYNVAKYLLKQRRNLIGYMDIHAYSQLWMTPWGYKRAYPNDSGEQMRVGKIAANALRNAGYGTTYKVGPSSVIIYATSGATDDWAYGFLGVKYSYGLELRDKGRHGFLLPAKQIIPTGVETFAAMKAMAQAIKL